MNEGKSVLVSIEISSLFIAWFNPDANKIKGGNRQYEQREYGPSLECYNDVLINPPKSPYIH